MSVASYRSLTIVGIAAIAVWLAFAPNVSAQPLDRKTTITIDQPFEFPGVALPAGTYVIKLVDILGGRNIVRIMSGDEKKVYATALGIPDFKMKTPEKGEFAFYESSAGQPQPLRAWFYPGKNYGVEFVYPKAKAVEIAKATGEHVIATEAEQPNEGVTINDNSLLEEPVFEVEARTGEEIPLTALHPTTAEALMAEEAQPSPDLPKTASPLALLGLAGFLAASAAAAVRIVRKSSE